MKRNNEQKAAPKPDFGKYSLALFKEGMLIHSESGSGIWPLVRCIVLMKRSIRNLSGCVLYDKVVGRAAAMLIAYSGFVSEVRAEVMTREAALILKKAKIRAASGKKADMLTLSDRASPCPEEVLSRKVPDSKLLFLELEERMKGFGR